MGSLLVAAQASSDTGGAMGGTVGLVVQLVLLFAVMYFLLIRPQQRRAKEHAAKMNAVQRGTEVVTGGGLIGKIVKVTDDVVEIELAQGVRVKALKSTLADVRGPGTPAND